MRTPCYSYQEISPQNGDVKMKKHTFKL
ncbi:hypothetical protein YPPY19_4203, partial [Yersinia pestis PY-19]